MDGIIIDAELHWRKAETSIFGQLGICLSPNLCELTKLMKVSEATDFWYRQKPWKFPILEVVEKELVSCIERDIADNGKALPGAIEMLRYFKECGFKIALTSRYPLSTITAVMEKFDIEKYFDVLTSSEEVYKSKPSPLVYFHTLEKLRLMPGEVIAFDNSEDGALAAVSAGIKSILVNQNEYIEDEKLIFSIIKLNSLLDYYKYITKNLI